MATDKSQVIGIKDLVPAIAGRTSRLPALVKDGLSTLFMRDHHINNIAMVLERNALRYGNRPAIKFEDKILTHTAFNDKVNQYARCLKNHGVKHGDVAIVFLENRLETLLITAAMAKLGAVASLINSNQRSKVLLHSINLRNDGIFIIGIEMIQAFEEIRNEITAKHRHLLFVVTDTDKETLPESYLDLNSLSSYESARNLPSARQLRAGTPFAYIFTSGTTGMPKASIQTHRRFLTCINWFGRINMGLNERDVIYITIPFFHSNALLVGWSCAAANGAAMAIRRKFSTTHFWDDSRKFGATAFVYIGDICRYLYNAPPSEGDKRHSIKKIVGNGLRPDIWQPFKERFDIEEVFEFYASSEGNLSFTNTLNINSTVGWCVSKYAIVVYDPEEELPIRGRDGLMQKVGKGEVGLMLSQINDRFPFPGYVNEEDNKKKIFRDVFEKGDMWFNTGDLMRDIGFWHTQFVDRVGDTFRWKGENVATAEVEAIVNALDNVATSAVYGVQIPGCDGRAGMAAIQLLDASKHFDGDKVFNALAAELPSYAVPVFVRIVSSFETTATFKIKKSVLKQEAWEVEDPVYIRYHGSNGYVLMDEKLRQLLQENRLQHLF